MDTLIDDLPEAYQKLNYQPKIAVLKPVFVHHFAGHILLPKYVQN
jgi:hypothetical protein